MVHNSYMNIRKKNKNSKFTLKIVLFTVHFKEKAEKNISSKYDCGYSKLMSQGTKKMQKTRDESYHSRLRKRPKNDKIMAFSLFGMI